MIIRPVNLLITLLRWSQWSDCSRSCGGGKRNRSRRCIQKKGDKKGCFNGGPRGDVRFREMVEECNLKQCPSESFISKDMYLKDI